jgi:predicted nucleic acid-binding protein
VARDDSQSSILIDASALIALLGGEPAAEEVREILSDHAAAMTTVNLAEAVDRLQRRYGLGSARTRPVIDALVDDALALIPLGPAEAWRAAEIRAEHYHRTRCPLSLADAVLIASAGPDGRVASSDQHMLRVAARERIAITALPDSRGRRARVE